MCVILDLIDAMYCIQKTYFTWFWNLECSDRGMNIGNPVSEASTLLLLGVASIIASLAIRFLKNAVRTMNRRPKADLHAQESLLK